MAGSKQQRMDNTYLAWRGTRSCNPTAPCSSIDQRCIIGDRRQQATMHDMRRFHDRFVTTKPCLNFAFVEVRATPEKQRNGELRTSIFHLNLYYQEPFYIEYYVSINACAQTVVPNHLQTAILMLILCTNLSTWSQF